jgi:hypothetical protein
MERCKLGGATDIKPTTRKDPATRAKFEDAGLDPDTDSKWQLGGKLGGGTDMSAKHRALPDTRLKLEDAGLNHETASKWQLGGKLGGEPKTHGEKGCFACFVAFALISGIVSVQGIFLSVHPCFFL